MNAVATFAVWGVLGTNALAALAGGWAWWRWSVPSWVWVLVRTGQAAAILLAVMAGVLAATGFSPDDGLFWLYALLPVAISFVAEQLRILSAQTVLDQRELPSAEAVGELEEEGQREIVLAILRREVGVMAIAAAVLVFLALRGLAEL